MKAFEPLLKNVAKGAKLREPQTEGLCNKLHYRLTFNLLLACSLMVACSEWIGNGNKIACTMDMDHKLRNKGVDWTIPQNVINTYCYVTATFTLPKHSKTKVGSENAKPGVGDFNPKKDEVHYKAYYQWVSFVLFFQAMTFYAPHYICKKWEGGKVMNIIDGLNRMILDKEARMTKERMLANYFVAALNTHSFWAIKLLLVDLLNVINVIGNIYLIDAFLGGEFSTYGLNVLSFLEKDPENRTDPMATIFPKVTKCTFYKYGASGTVQNHDAICVLPINIINEKIYVFLWFWLIVLSVISIIGLINHVVSMHVPSLITKKKLLMKARNRHALDEVGQYMDIGDWELLYILATNMDQLVLNEFLQELTRAIRNEKQKISVDLPLLETKGSVEMT